MKKTAHYIALIFIGLLPFNVLAAEGRIAQSSGFSDLTLLTIMLSIIGLLLLIIYALSKSIQGIGGLSPSPQIKKEDKKASKGQKLNSTIALLVLSTTSLNIFAANGNSANSSFIMGDTLFWILICFILLLAFIVFILYKSLQTLIKLEKGEEVSPSESEGVFEGLLTDRVAVEDEEEVMLDHEYDGIRELDNNLPPWWVYLFYATIIFSVIYLIRFHITGDGKSGVEEYEIEMAEAAAKKEEMMANNEDRITRDNVTYLSAASSIEAGEAIYKGNCATCHGQLGEGGAGPNLTDEYWIHGGSIKDIFAVITDGVPEKGMISWKSQFSPEQIQKVSSYIMTLKGTDPPNQKAPQGELYENDEENKDENPLEEVQEEETGQTANEEV